MERLSTPHLPAHLVHPTAGVTLTVLAWILIGGIITAVGGLTASRAHGNKGRVALGMALAIAGVAVVGSAVVYHNSLNQAVAPHWS